MGTAKLDGFLHRTRDRFRQRQIPGPGHGHLAAASGKQDLMRMAAAHRLRPRPLRRGEDEAGRLYRVQRRAHL